MPYHQGTELAGVYATAKREGYGFVASNLTHPDILQGLLTGAAAADSDLVIQIKRDTAEYLGNGDVEAGLDIVDAVLRAVGDSVDIGVFLNVDHVHADDTALLDAVIETGPPASVMVDASEYAFEENIRRTAAAVDRITRASEETLVEAELGTIRGTESGVRTDDALYTDPDEAVEFVDRTGCDLLAVSIGTEHGVAAGVDLDLRIELAEEIDTALRDQGFDIPLVVHGSSGLTPDQVTALMETGVCKLNTNTRYQYEYARTACEFYHEHVEAVRPPEGVADDRTTFFADADWAPDKRLFNPQLVGRIIRERIATVHAELARIAGSAGESRYPTDR